MNPKHLLDMYELQPKKSLGQNFLHDPNALDKIVQIAELTPEDSVLEVGPGTGSLTIRLAQSVARVVAVETDGRLIPILKRQLGDYTNVSILHGDILETDVSAIMGSGDYVVVANLPYYITSAILRHLLERSRRPKRLVLTVQQEVAERLVAGPGEMSVLSVSVQFYGKAQIVTRLGAGAFWPRPEVASAVVRIDSYEQPVVDVPDEAEFFRVVKAGFGQKRKQIKNAIGSALGISHIEASELLDQAHIDPTRRAETLNLSEWAALTRTVLTKLPPHQADFGGLDYRL